MNEFRCALLAKLYSRRWHSMNVRSEKRSLGQMYHFLVPTIWDSQKSLRKVLDDGEARRPRANLAGMLFLFRLRCSIHHPEFQEGCKAAVVVSNELNHGLTLGGDKIHASEDLLKKCWPEFRAVAHIHAALNLIINLRTEESGSDSDPPSETRQLFSDFLSNGNEDPESLKVWLSVADFLATEAKRVGLLLPKDQIWEVPTDLDLPEPGIQVPALSEKTLDTLSKLFPSN